MTTPEPTADNQGLTGRQLSEAERNQAAHALSIWFQQNDISAKEGALVMVQLIAACLLDKTTDILQLQEGVQAFHMGLVYEIALRIRRMRK